MHSVFCVRLVREARSTRRRRYGWSPCEQLVTVKTVQLDLLLLPSTATLPPLPSLVTLTCGGGGSVTTQPLGTPELPGGADFVRTHFLLA